MPVFFLAVYMKRESVLVHRAALFHSIAVLTNVYSK